MKGLRRAFPVVDLVLRRQTLLVAVVAKLTPLCWESIYCSSLQKMMRPSTRSFSPSTPTITASPSRAPAPVNAWMFS